jgi:amino-acid N-acetyltransferase
LILEVAMHVRDALPEDLGPISDLMSPAIAAGLVLPRNLRPEELQVAVDRTGAVVGVVGLAPWSNEVVELGSLVSNRRGAGRLLVAAALEEAARRGFRTVVCLTGIPEFFEKVGFSLVPERPWALARGCATLRSPELPELAPAVAAKSNRCAACPRLAGCSQTLLARRVATRPALQLGQKVA